ncbi:MAG: hypothetical protein FD175_2535 [Beijerinckiaceae bacterium]|nr:MAG: hypothetical protein FD175_2535 [Beijerinckiaceae bacterium]
MSIASHPVASLKAMLRAHLLADAAITGITGTAVFETPPRGTKPPYILLGDAVAAENDAVEYQGAIIDLDIVAYAAERGTAGVLALASALEAALAQPLPVLVDHRLVALEIRQSATRHDVAAALSRATLRLRAITEPL